MIICKKCGEEPKIANSHLGFCVDCRSEYDKERQRKNYKKYYYNNSEKLKERRRNYRENNSDTIKKKARDYYKDNREKALVSTRRCYLQRNYGLTPEEFEEMLENQGGRCAICRSTDPGAQRLFNVDHDHSTGKIRALLCNRCNSGLGQFNDDYDTVIAAAEYLLKHSEANQY